MPQTFLRLIHWGRSQQTSAWVLSHCFLVFNPNILVCTCQRNITCKSLNQIWRAQRLAKTIKPFSYSTQMWWKYDRLSHYIDGNVLNYTTHFHFQGVTISSSVWVTQKFFFRTRMIKMDRNRPRKWKRRSWTAYIIRRRWVSPDCRIRKNTLLWEIKKNPRSYYK